MALNCHLSPKCYVAICGALRVNMSKRPAIEAIDASASATIAPATGQGDPGLAPAPGDGGTPALERQDTGWANASSDKKGAAKRLVGRLKRKVANSDLVRKLKSGGDGGVDSNSESEPGDATSDDGSEYYSDPVSRLAFITFMAPLGLSMRISVSS